MTYRTLIEALPGLQKLVVQDLPLNVAYRLAKIIRRVNDEMEIFKDQRKVIFERHELSPTLAKDDIDKLLDLEIEWDAPVLDVEITDKLTLSVADVHTLEPFIRFVEKEGDANEQNP